jgi:hypothetical protein
MIRTPDPVPDDPAPFVCAIAAVPPIKNASAIVAINFVPSILVPKTTAFSGAGFRQKPESNGPTLHR